MTYLTRLVALSAGIAVLGAGWACAQTSPDEFTVPELVFVGVGDQAVDYAVPELVFVGVGAQSVEFTAPELVFVGVGAQNVEFTVPELVFVGVGEQAIEHAVPELVFVGVGAQSVEFTVPELVFVGVGEQAIEYSVPELVFVGVGAQSVEFTVPELVFVGVGEEAAPGAGNTGAMKFEPGALRREGSSADRMIEVRPRRGSAAAPNLRRLTVQVFLTGNYQAQRRNGHEIILTLREGHHDSREVVSRFIPDISGDQVTPIDIDISLRGAVTIAPGQWPDSDESNARYWYRFVSMAVHLETGQGETIDQIGPYCYDAAEVRFVGMGQCQSQPTVSD